MALRFARFAPASLVLVLVIGIPVGISRPAPVSASADGSMASTILSALNADRARLGLRSLRVDPRMAGLAADRARWMASTGDLSHSSFGGEVWTALDARGVATYSSGEAIGSTTAAWGNAAASYLYGLWRDSPEHWALMMSGTYNYIGIGLAYRAETAETYGSLVFAEGPDTTRPVSEMTGAGVVAGRTIFFRWRGRDALLQTHTAGLRDFDVQLRVDNGPWSTIRTHMTSTQLILTNRRAGHTYSARVRDRDRRNNLSQWSRARTVSL
jgi:uncharacterized protein YkwD